MNACLRARAARWTMAALVVLACGLVAPFVHAHAAGVSHGGYTLRSAELVAHLVFANAELSSALPAVDANGDGALTIDELASKRDVVEREIAARTTVTADGKACPVSLAGATITEQDGVDVELHARCDDRPKHLVVHCGFLDVLSASHRHFAVVSVDDGQKDREAVLLAGNVDLAVDVGASTGSSATSSFWLLLKLGVEHILTGYDHLVFLFGLILLGGRVASIVGALTAFTLSHSISLALAVLGVWAPSPAFVEPAIALSIAYVGLENFWLLRKRPDSPDFARGRWRITFPFGLVHGFGFAGALQEIGLPRARIPAALLAFNLGVEVGQLAVLAIILPAILYARRWTAMRGAGTTVANAGIVVAGLVWFVSRVFA
jgi:hydrogenase/urease accessory protein HupE